ncbi:MAG TPA: MBL fold metallo-hydrolase, partial [Anaerolineaceae bacterium]|nr:MBL fold metallo-hydrolase [Anaerolineaceae bacterium]
MSTIFTWYGHATIGLDCGGITLVVDPFFSGNPAAPVKAQNVRADFVLISHGHGDHVGDALDIARRTGATVIANAEISGW